MQRDRGAAGTDSLVSHRSTARVSLSSSQHSSLRQQRPQLQPPPLRPRPHLSLWSPPSSALQMSHSDGVGSNKRKGDNEMYAHDEADGEERKEDKKSRRDPEAASSSIEELLCSVCLEPFECADGAARLPRLLPCGRHQLCSSCIVASIKVNPGSVLCPKGHGLLPISAAGVAAAALSTADDWMRLLPPFADFIAAIRNQQLMMTRLAQKGVECTHQGCKAVVTHFCVDCGDLCSTHERKRHSIEPFKSHKQTTMPIANKAAFFQQQRQSKIAGPAAKIRSHCTAILLQQQQLTTVAAEELKQLEAQLQIKRQEVEAKQKTLGAIKQTVDTMSAADDSAVLELEADRLEAKGLAAASVRPMADSTILTTLDNKRVADLQTFLGPNRLLSKATLIYRASRDGFAARDWWRQCGGKFNLLTLIRVARNGFVCGAFTPFQWPVGVPAESEWIADPTGATFLFSLVNAHGRAVKLRLKESGKASAGLVVVGWGPLFGGGADLALMSDGKSADSPDGNYARPSSFEFDCAADGGVPIAHDKTLLAGDDGKGEAWFVRFAAAEIESWQL